VSRAIGVLPQLIIDRAVGAPIERYVVPCRRRGRSLLTLLVQAQVVLDREVDRDRKEVVKWTSWVREELRGARRFRVLRSFRHRGMG